MTTIVTSPDPAAADQLPPPQPVGNPNRMISIRADLLPDEIILARKLRKSRRVVIIALVGVVVLLAGWYAVVTLQTARTRDTLRAEQQDVLALTRRQNSFADVVNAQAESKAIKSQLGALLAEDLSWSAVLSAVRDAAPSGIAVNGIYAGLRSANATPGGAAGVTTGGASGNNADTSGSTGLPNASGKKLVGSVTVTGAGPDKDAVAGYVDALGKVPGLGNPMLADTNLQDGLQRFTIRVDLTAAALGGRFTKPADGASGDGASGDSGGTK